MEWIKLRLEFEKRKMENERPEGQEFRAERKQQQNFKFKSSENIFKYIFVQ